MFIKKLISSIFKDISHKFQLRCNHRDLNHVVIIIKATASPHSSSINWHFRSASNRGLSLSSRLLNALTPAIR